MTAEVLGIAVALGVVGGYFMYKHGWNKFFKYQVIPVSKSLDLEKLNSLKTKKDLISFANENSIKVNQSAKKEDIRAQIIEASESLSMQEVQ